MLHLELKHLRLVAAIADVANMTRAAQTLCLSQPALSKQLAELEAQLGFPLFHRTPKAMYLTEAGRIFRTRATAILAEIGQLEAELTVHAHGTAGKLRLGIDRMHDSSWLPALVAQFRNLHPGIELEFRQVPVLLESLQQREIDIAIVGEALEAHGIAYEALHGDEMLAVLPPGHQLARKDWISVHDLQGMDLLYFFDLQQSYLYRRYLHPNRVKLGSFHRIENVAAIVQLVQDGQGISILPARLLNAAGKAAGLVLRPIGQQGFHFNWFAAMPSAAAAPHAATCISLLRNLGA